MSESYDADLRNVMDEFDFPVAHYLKTQIRDAVTLSRTGSWWSAALLIEDPRSRKQYVAMYRWHLRGGAWKRVSKFTCRTRRDVDTLRSFFDSHYAALS